MVKSFAELIRVLRSEYRYRQKDLAEAIGTQASVVGKWEQDRQNPSRILVQVLGERFPKYRARLYVSARLLPLQLDKAAEYHLSATLERLLASDKSRR